VEDDRLLAVHSLLTDKPVSNSAPLGYPSWEMIWNWGLPLLFVLSKSYRYLDSYLLHASGEFFNPSIK